MPSPSPSPSTTLQLPSLLSLHLPSPSQTSFSSCPVRRHNASLRCTNTLYNGVVSCREGGREGTTGGDRNDDISSERRTPSDPPAGGPATSSRNRPSLSYPLLTVEDTKYEESIRSCIEGGLADTSRTSPATFERLRLKIKRQVIAETDASHGQQRKKRRGRPRKQK